MQVPASVGVLVEMRQAKAGPELSAHLLLHGVGELDPLVISERILIERFVREGVEGKTVADLRLVVVKEEVDPVVKAAEQDTALFQNTEAFLKNGFHLFHIAV